MQDKESPVILYRMYKFRRITAYIVLIVGLSCMILGIAFLLGTITGISRFSILMSFLLVIIGAFFAVLAIKLDKRSTYLFFATFLILLGSFLFLSAMQIIPVSLSEGWPLVSVFGGLALLPAGWRRYRAFLYRYVIPSLAFVTLGCTLLVFSFKMVSFSFRRFIIDWWPLLLIIAGIVLVLLSLGSKGKEKPGNGDEFP